MTKVVQLDDNNDVMTTLMIFRHDGKPELPAHGNQLEVAAHVDLAPLQDKRYDVATKAFIVRVKN